MTELPTPTDTANVTGVIDRYYDRMMSALDNLGIGDEKVIAILRAEGYSDEADMYQDWIIDEDPARDYREPNPPEGVVPDPPNPSYEPLAKELEAMRRATEITYEWIEQEELRYSCRITLNRSQVKTWLNANLMSDVEPEDIDAEDLAQFLEENTDAAIGERRWPGDTIEVSYQDLKVVQQ